MPGRLAKANAQIRGLTDARIIRRTMNGKTEYAAVKNGRRVANSPTVATSADLETIVAYLLRGGSAQAAS